MFFFKSEQSVNVLVAVINDVFKGVDSAKSLIRTTGILPQLGANMMYLAGTSFQVHTP